MTAQELAGPARRQPHDARGPRRDAAAGLAAQGVVVLRPEEVHDPWVRQALVNEADRRYGRRRETPMRRKRRRGRRGRCSSRRSARRIPRAGSSSTIGSSTPSAGCSGRAPSMRAMHDAGREFQRSFILAQLDPLRAADLLRVPGAAVSPSRATRSSPPAAGCTGHSWRWAATTARRAPAPGTCWAAAASVREWALRQGWGGRPVRQEQAQGIWWRHSDCWRRTTASPGGPRSGLLSDAACHRQCSAPAKRRRLTSPSKGGSRAADRRNP